MKTKTDGKIDRWTVEQIDCQKDRYTEEQQINKQRGGKQMDEQMSRRTDGLIDEQGKR
jgi:hypothetical protein